MSDASDLSELGKAALHYLELGYRVFPLVPGRKKPRTVNGFKDATDDRVRVIKWWTETPDANIGIATGGGVFVLDVDRLDGPEGPKSVDNPYLSPLSERLEELGADSISRSPSGGHHLWFRTDSEFGSNAGEIAEGVDHRCGGGYIVAPPSVLDEREKVPGRYEWLELREAQSAHELVPLPPSVAQAIGGSKKRKAPLASVDADIQEGRRHAALVREAAVWRGKGLGEAGLIAHLLDFNRKRCNPPTEEEEVRRIATDYARKDEGEEEGWVFAPRRACDIEEEAVEWLIDGRIPRGMMTTFVGLPGAGKSAFATFIASKVSTGKGMSEHEAWSAREPGDVLYLCFEESHGAIVKKRLEEMGADMSRVRLEESVRKGDLERCFNLSRDLERLRAWVDEVRPSLLIIDPVNTPWPSDKNPNSDVEVREVLDPYRRLASDFGCAVILITHTNKRSDLGDAQDAAGGARAMLGISRAAYLFGSWRGDEGEYERFMLDLKVNIRAPRSALEFAIRGKSPDDPRVSVTVKGLRDLDANTFFREKAKREREAREERGESKVAEAARFAVEELEESCGWMLSTELTEALISRGVAKKTADDCLRAMRRKREVITKKERKAGGKHITFLPGREPPGLREDRDDR